MNTSHQNLKQVMIDLNTDVKQIIYRIRSVQNELRAWRSLIIALERKSEEKAQRKQREFRPLICPTCSGEMTHYLHIMENGDANHVWYCHTCDFGRAMPHYKVVDKSVFDDPEYLVKHLEREGGE